MFALLMAPVVLLMPFGPFLKWRQAQLPAAFRSLLPALAVALIAAVLGGCSPAICRSRPSPAWASACGSASASRCMHSSRWRQRAARDAASRRKCSA